MAILYNMRQKAFQVYVCKNRTELGYYQVWFIGDFSVVRKSAKHWVGLFHPGRPVFLNNIYN